MVDPAQNADGFFPGEKLGLQTVMIRLQTVMITANYSRITTDYNSIRNDYFKLLRITA
jgi:hypothetical protein